MAERPIDDDRGKMPVPGSRRLTADEIAELRRSGREALEYCRMYFRENPL